MLKQIILLSFVSLFSSGIFCQKQKLNKEEIESQRAFLERIEETKNSIFGTTRSKPKVNFSNSEMPVYFKRKGGTAHLVITYFSSDSLITTNLYLHQEAFIYKNGVYKNDERTIKFNDRNSITFKDENGFDRLYLTTSGEYLKHRIPNIYVINRADGQKLGVIIKDHVFYDPFILRDSSEYILSELAMQLTMSNIRYFHDDESNYDIEKDGTINLKGCYLCPQKTFSIILNKSNIKNRHSEKVDIYRFNFDHIQQEGCMFGDCYNGRGVQRIVVQPNKAIIIEGNFIDGKLEGKGMVTTVNRLGRNYYFQTKLIVEHTKGVPNGQGVEYRCGLKYELEDGLPLYRKGLWKDGVFLEGIDYSDPDDLNYQDKTLRDYLNDFFSSVQSNSNNNSDFTIAEGSQLLNVQKSSLTSANSVIIHVKDGGLFSSNVCQGSYLVSFEDKFGGIHSTSDPYNDSSDEVGCNSYSFPITCRIQYKNRCSDTQVKRIVTTFIEPGTYNINLEEW